MGEYFTQKKPKNAFVQYRLSKEFVNKHKNSDIEKNKLFELAGKEWKAMSEE